MRHIGIADPIAGGQQLGRQAIIVGVERRQIGPQRHAGGARQRRKARDRVGPLLVGERQRIGQVQAGPPHRCCRSPRSCPHGSTARRQVGTHCRQCCSRRSGSGCAGARSSPAAMIMWPRASAAGRAAHVLLHDQHAAGRLDVEPAGVEADALADQRDPPRIRAPPASLPGPSQTRSISRGGRSLARPTAWIIGKFLAMRSSPTMLDTRAPCCLASSRAASSSSAGPRSLAGVLMRSRPSQTPSTTDSARA